MPVPKIKFGYLPDPVDSRDRAIATDSESLRRLPESVDLRNPAGGRNFILDQSDLSSCVANAVLGGIRLHHLLKGIVEAKLGSRLLTYWGARQLINTADWDSGSHIRDAFRFLNLVGYMPEEDTVNKYDIRRFREAPTPVEQRLMFDQKDKGEGQVKYSRIFSSGNRREYEIKRALADQCIPVLGTETTEAFLEYQGGVLHRPRPGTRSTGGHAVYLVGYDEESVIAANSWNIDFGEDGYIRLAWDYIDWEETRDIWCIEHAPYFSNLRAA